jgi:hypothetical protein
VLSRAAAVTSCHYADPHFDAAAGLRRAGSARIPLEVGSMRGLVGSARQPAEDLLPCGAKCGPFGMCKDGVALRRNTHSADPGCERIERPDLRAAQILETVSVAAAHDAVELRIASRPEQAAVRPTGTLATAPQFRLRLRRKRAAGASRQAASAGRLRIVPVSCQVRDSDWRCGPRHSRTRLRPSPVPADVLPRAAATRASAAARRRNR